MGKQCTLVQVSRTDQAVSTQIARAYISAGTAASSRSTAEAIMLFENAQQEINDIIESLRGAVL